MKRLWSFVLFAAIAVWAGALLDFKRPRSAERVPTHSDSDSDSAAAAVPERSAPTRAPAASAPRLVPTPAAAPIGPPVAAGRAEPALDAPPRRSAFQVVGKMARALLTATRGAVPTREGTQPEPAPVPTGELGEGALSPEYTELEQHYVEEARNGEWASAHEQRIRGLLHEQALESKLALVNCQETVCRIVLETDSPEAFTQLLQTPGIAQATTLSAKSPYSFRSGQLSVLFHPSAQAEPTP